MKLKVIDERHPGKVAGVYDHESNAHEAMKLLREVGGFSAEEVDLIAPNDAHFGSKVEPDDKGIGRGLLGSHIIFGGGGLILGLILATFLSLYGPVLTTSSPVMVFISMATLGTFAGLLVAGLISLRPDHDELINDTRHATNHNQWTVVVQIKDDSQKDHAKQLMQGSAVSISDTL
jgi:hypothetical protein